jgi:hypothetical protein
VPVPDAPGVGEGDGFEVYGVEFAESMRGVLAEGDQAGPLQALKHPHMTALTA